MVKKQAELEQDIKKFIGELKNTIDVEKAILYGSYARGNPHKDSDIDLAVVSPDFAKMDLFERAELLGRTVRECDHLLEPLAYSPEEFFEADTPSPLIKMIRNTGKVVYDASGEKN